MLERPRLPTVVDENEEAKNEDGDEVNIKEPVMTHPTSTADVMSNGVQESAEPATLAEEDAVAASEHVIKQSMSGISAKEGVTAPPELDVNSAGHSIKSQS